MNSVFKDYGFRRYVLLGKIRKTEPSLIELSKVENSGNPRGQIFDRWTTSARSFVVSDKSFAETIVKSIKSKKST